LMNKRLGVLHRILLAVLVSGFPWSAYANVLCEAELDSLRTGTNIAAARSANVVLQKQIDQIAKKLGKEKYSAAIHKTGLFNNKAARLDRQGRLGTGADELNQLSQEVLGCIDRITNPPPPLVTGLQTMQSGGVEREYYLQLSTDYDDGTGVQATALGDDTRKPLLFAYHGYTGSYQNWVGDNRFYDLVDVVGDDAIIVVPNGLPNASDQRVWGGQKDLDFFGDMLAELDMRGLQYNPNKIFVVGHSNGAGFAHELGCAYGDVIRGVATAAGALSSTDCVGSMAMLMMQGSNDPLTAGSLAQGALNYWVLYNGWDKAAFVPATVGPCDDYSFPGELNSDFPVLWCEHTQGHDWPDFGSQTVWDFLTGLAEVEPAPDAPFGGGSVRATPQPDAFLTFQIDVPAEMNRPVRGVATLRPLSWVDTPTCSAPDIVLGTFAVDGFLVPGQVSELITIPVTYLDFSRILQFPSDEFALSLTVYVEGGSTSVIPTPFVDYDAAAPISLVAKNSDVVMPEVLTLAPIPNLCGF
jgi:predicted esterase